MKEHLVFKRLGIFFALLLGVLWVARPVAACGGLFCQNSPVDQNAERIIFTDNGDGTITAIIQINYTGFAPDFSWILPLPSPITAEDIAVPEDAMDAFMEIERMTNPRFIPPQTPDCAQIEFEEFAEEGVQSAGDVEIFASGEVGPFGFDVIGSDDPAALITWLRDNAYTVTESMEPLINVYVDEQFVFLAMRLLPDQGTQDIQPVAVTYASENPMIPLRLTAVAANPDMAVLTWFFADAQAVPDNYAHMEIDDRDITFFTFGGNDYRSLLRSEADRFNGQAFVTEYAQPTAQISFNNPLLQDLSARHRYLTRLNTVISPEEMTLDPVFSYDTRRADVSNVHDLSNARGQYDCERDNTNISLPFISSSGDTTLATISPVVWVAVGALLSCGAVVLLVAGVFIGRRLFA